jgi:hypothetical protein
MQKFAVVAGLIVCCLLFTESYVFAGVQGRVVEVNLSSKIIGIRGGDGIVRFDASRPIFRGYRSLSDVHRGDVVLLSYRPDGLMVGRIGRGMIAEEEVCTTPQKKKDVKGFVRIAKKGNPDAFENVDANKDGRITPVELTVVIPNLSMDQFRQYDKKGCGYLDRVQFQELMRNRTL